MAWEQDLDGYMISDGTHGREKLFSETRKHDQSGQRFFPNIIVNATFAVIIDSIHIVLYPCVTTRNKVNPL